MLNGLVKKLFGSRANVQIVDSPFEPVRVLKREGVLNIEEVEDRVGGGSAIGYYHFVRTEKVEGKVLEIKDKTISYARVYKPDEKIRGVELKLQNDEGAVGESCLPIELLGKLDRQAILNQRVAYEHASERLCERCLGGDNRSHKYSLTVLTGQLSGENYSSNQFEVC